ncbi:hypothetical protein BGZ73_005738 [Actinomortierella ambigua]|nr:hypothetical protein BGZ73_005738 [Actinomortierella ambigua]
MDVDGATNATANKGMNDAMKELGSLLSNVRLGVGLDPSAPPSREPPVLVPHTHVGRNQNRIQPTDDIFNTEDPRIKEDIIRMIMQYLIDEGYTASAMTIQDESNVKWHEREENIQETRRLKKAILDGEWADVEKICSKPLFKNQKSFLFAVYKQQYLEYIEHREMQKAFTFLQKRLKPLEHHQKTPAEFKDLCYLLTTKSIHDAPSFKNWEGIAQGRDRLVEHFQSMLEVENTTRGGTAYVPPNRLLTLLRQAVAYQIEVSRYHPTISPNVDTLLEDFSPLVIPNATRTIMRGHRGNVKCAEFIGSEGRSIASGSSDNTVRVWDTESGHCTHILEGHSSRIWDLSSNDAGTTIASASGDSTVKIWDIKGSKGVCRTTLTGHSGDVYTVKYHPTSNHVVSGGYDKIVRFYDLTTGQIVKTFSGHQLAVSKTILNPIGNLIVTGSKDNTIKFWDLVSGVCIRTITSHLGEVTSVSMNANGTLLLSSSKDNSNRLWDVRMIRPLRKFKGHQNTSKNFVRSGFAHNSLIVGGSEDGQIYIWDQESGEIVQKLRGHEAMVYNAVWSPKQSMFVSSSDDRSVRTWYFKW